VQYRFRQTYSVVPLDRYYGRTYTALFLRIIRICTVSRHLAEAQTAMNGASVFDLSHLGEIVVRICFELASDEMGTARGWYIDNVQISDNWEGIKEYDELNVNIPVEAGISTYPNPFNQMCNITVDVPQGARTIGNIMIYDITGTYIGRLPVKNTAGTHNILWSADNIKSGVYLLKFTVDNITSTQKVILLK
jgi:hypothetical protein